MGSMSAAHFCMQAWREEGGPVSGVPNASHAMGKGGGGQCMRQPAHRAMPALTFAVQARSYKVYCMHSPLARSW